MTEPALADTPRQEGAPKAPSIPQTAKKTRVFSGMQPSGELHLGNYVGALQHWVARQDESDNIFCIVDLHALTIPEQIDARALHDNARKLAALYLASGLDPERNLIFIQSHVREHSELAWILNCATPLGWLQRMTQFKSKAQQFESTGTGLLIYPALQAADILLYDTDAVPVGEDQRQHIELTRDIAIRFHRLFGEVFKLPVAVIPEVGARVMGLDDPETKMSKSLAVTRPGHAINLLDDEKTIRKAIMSAVTDSGRETRFAHASPGVRNLLSIYQALTREPMSAVEATFAGQGYGALKKALVEVVWETLRPLQARYHEIMADRAGLEAVLTRGAERAREIASATMQRVRDATGVG
ncbi:tryptophan--tRNA ligase [Truepera radiovictrix]|uniref:Tryptophan--tRNA ligase n=1 Tax=Truepera radiovictrix (strain DSM 17093 / CIP 108686 / LMG 22925 / RQ-24) TaxID=649638 RepID=D7CXH3_TRURR|nr:tryptophan--tRNA ligase [Truepera radiovictrix]ADI14575.1 tryptophanyl-tRNA synthetase [Truepera radiovictrix DSM 17093]WMT56875.1 tryptophan--tRNA ligase [Truepera radiovictrix]